MKIFLRYRFSPPESVEFFEIFELGRRVTLGVIHSKTVSNTKVDLNLDHII